MKLATFAGLALVSLAAACPAGAGPHMIKEVMGAGLPVPTCQYCHTSAMPTKETSVKGQWLKNYPGGQ